MINTCKLLLAVSIFLFWNVSYAQQNATESEVQIDDELRKVCLNLIINGLVEKSEDEYLTEKIELYKNTGSVNVLDAYIELSLSYESKQLAIESIYEPMVNKILNVADSLDIVEETLEEDDTRHDDLWDELQTELTRIETEMNDTLNSFIDSAWEPAKMRRLQQQIKKVIYFDKNPEELKRIETYLKVIEPNLTSVIKFAESHNRPELELSVLELLEKLRSDEFLNHQGAKFNTYENVVSYQFKHYGAVLDIGYRADNSNVEYFIIRHKGKSVELDLNKENTVITKITIRGIGEGKEKYVQNRYTKTYFRHDGDRLEQIDYMENGELVMKKYYQEDGTWSVFKYENGQRHGPARFYYESNALNAECNYVNGNKEGEYLIYYEDGTLEARILHQDDERHGKCQWYYPNGQLKYEVENFKGNLIKLYDCYDLESNKVDHGNLVNGNGTRNMYSDETGELEEVWNYIDGQKITE